MDQNIDTKTSSSVEVEVECKTMSDADISKRFGRETNGISPIVKEPVSSVANEGTHITSPHKMAELNSEKKPSYLNLACCVNGYSNLTTYDSKVRQDINKSREVSPIRPSSNSIPYCKKSNSITPPKFLNSLDVVDKSVSFNDKHAERNNNSNLNMSNWKASENENAVSFIQQRVERLYGPGALAQGFYSPRKPKSNPRELNESLCEGTSELYQKFKTLMPNKCNFESTMKVGLKSRSESRQTTETNGVTENLDVDLPVMRHLSQEFRLQLPVISPKKQPTRVDDFAKNKSPVAEVIQNQTNGKYSGQSSVCASNENVPVRLEKQLIAEKKTNAISVKDGHYFLIALKQEQSRLLLLADEAEKYIEMLLETPDRDEEVLGILRSASGKARLLVSQKLKQFEGLCHKNINCSPDDEFPTTLDDLQGFWDMVYLQVDHINSIFTEIKAIQNNGWKVCNKVSEPVKVQPNTPNKSNNKKTKSVDSGGSKPLTESALKRESQRKQLQEMKRKHRMAMTVKNHDNGSDELVSKSANSMMIFVNDNVNIINN